MQEGLVLEGVRDYRVSHDVSLSGRGVAVPEAAVYTERLHQERRN
jgi:hypothetical protein